MQVNLDEFTNALENSRGMKKYEILRDGLYQMGLPLSEDEIDSIFMEYEETGDLPNFVYDMAE